jgi:uncharacterized protein YbjQ (UPF0145 family)
MICPDCGFNQARGDRCQQCGAVLVEKESGGGKPAEAPSPPQAPAHKHRSHPLHDLDLTISVPGIPPEKIQENKVPSKERPGADKPHGTPSPDKHAPEQKFTSAKDRPGTEKLADAVLCTTTPGIEGKRITTYLGLVSGSDYMRGNTAEEYSRKAKESGADAELRQARSAALVQLKREAANQGADAVIGISSTLAFDSQGLWIVLTGTAVRLNKA